MNLRQSAPQPLVAAVREAGETIASRLRVSEPWQYKFPLLMAIVYVPLYSSGAASAPAATTIVWSICTATGIAVLAYLGNDVTDRRSDAAAGRRNGVIGCSRRRLLAIALGGAVAALVPWFVHFRRTPLFLGLLAVEFALLMAYAFPPLRLKERGLAGVVADALYAHALPGCLATVAVANAGGLTLTRWLLAMLGALVAWQFALGVRNILQHQLSDFDADAASGTRTYTTREGRERIERVLRRIVVPAELTTWLVWVAVTSRVIPTIAVGVAVHTAVIAWHVRYRWRLPLLSPMSDRLYLFVDRFNLRWLALCVLAAFVWRDLSMAVVLIAHVLLFPNGIADALAVAAGRFRSAGRQVDPRI